LKEAATCFFFIVMAGFGPSRQVERSEIPLCSKRGELALSLSMGILPPVIGILQLVLINYGGERAYQ
jgi:hypothetical protein